jgi:NADPH2:quinone reductase
MSFGRIHHCIYQQLAGLTRLEERGLPLMSFQQNFEVRSTLKADGVLELSLVETPVPLLGNDEEVIVEVKAAPINPADIRTLIGPADTSTAKETGTADHPVTTLQMSEDLFGDMNIRLNRSLPVGIEGAGIVVAASNSAAGQSLMGKVVAVMGRGMYARYRKVSAADCLVMPKEISPADAASCFVNPLTALGMIETMREEGHQALIHTAAASNLGQMLSRVCVKDGIPLVNVVRSPSQVALLKETKAQFVCDMNSKSFDADLVGAIRSTGARLAFDATGGGTMAGRLIFAMDSALIADPTTLRSYSSEVRKYVYIYGNLEAGPTVVHRKFGTSWTLGGWSLPSFLGRTAPERLGSLKRRIADEIKTSFASHYGKTLSLGELLTPTTIQAMVQRATGQKYLLDPSLPLTR